MKNPPKILYCLIFILIFSVIVLPEIKDGFGIGKSYAAEDKDSYTTIVPASEDVTISGKFVFRIYGYGHGVGMSQRGAIEMAKKGSTYEEILTHYYPDTTIKEDSATPETVKYGGEEIPLIEYICKTTKKEMGYSNSGREALKAQMSAVYTLAKFYGFDVASSKHAYDNNFAFEGTEIHKACLEYLEIASLEDKPVAKYVDYNGSVAFTCYFSSSAGKTASASSVWGGNQYPYLSGGVTSFENLDTAEYEIPTEKMKELIEAYSDEIVLSDNPADWLEVIDHDSCRNENCGYVATIRVGNSTMRGNAFRASLMKYKIRSHCFTVEYICAEEATSNNVSATEEWPNDSFNTTTIDYPYTTTKCYDYPEDDFDCTTVPTTTYPWETTTCKDDVDDWWDETTTATTVYTTSPENWHETTTVASNRISDIYISDITFIDGYDGYWDYEYYWDEIKGNSYFEYYRYNICPQELTVIYADGTRFTGTPDEVYSETGYWLNLNDNQSYENQWSVGNYYVSASLGNARTTYKVKIIDTPIENIELNITKSKLTENVDGNLIYEFNETGEIINSYFNYDVWWVDVGKITFKKGFEHYDDGSYGYSIIDNQSHETPWGVGKHTITFSCLGYEQDFEIEVVANPYKVKNVSVEAGRYLIENNDGYITNDYIYNESTDEYTEVEYFHYDAGMSYPIITIEFEDGMIISGRDYQINEQIDVYPSVSSYQSYETPWGLGRYTAYLDILGEIYPFEVEVVPNPISGIEFIKAPDKTEYILGEYPDLKGAVVRINYTSGDYTDIPFSTDSSSYTTYSFDKKIKDVCGLDILKESFTTIGVNNITAYYYGFSCTYPVTVKDKKIDVITIRNSEEKDLLIDAYYSDGTTDTMKVLNFYNRYGDGEGDLITHGGLIFTDKGIFETELYFYDNSSCFIKFRNPTNGQWIQSNKLNDCPWLKLYLKYSLLDSWFWSSLVSEQDNKAYNNFCGKITEDNIDLIVLMSAAIKDCSYYSRQNLQPAYNSNYIIQAIKDAFFVETIDLKLTKKYNPQTNTIELDLDSLAGWSVKKQIQPKYKDGYWYVEMRGIVDFETLTYGSLYFVFDDDLRIVAFSTEKMPVIEKTNIAIKQPTETVISYGDSIILHVDSSNIPVGGYVEWTVSNSNFETEVSADGTTCKITPKTSGDTTFTATVYDAEGKIISSDEQTMTSKANFFDRLIAFFKKIFGLTKVFPQVFKGISL